MGPAARPTARQSSPSTAPPAASPRKSSPSTAPPAASPRKNSPGTPKNSVFRPFWACRANFFALTPTPGRAGRTFSRTGHGHTSILKEKSPLHEVLRAVVKHFSPTRVHKSQFWPFSTKQGRCFFQDQTKTTNQASNPNTPNQTSATWQRRKDRKARLRCPRAAARPGRATSGRQWAAVGGQCYKRRQTNAIHITTRGLLLQTSSISAKKPLFSPKKPSD